MNYINKVKSYSSNIIVSDDHYNSTHYNPSYNRPQDGHLRTSNGDIEYYDSSADAWIPYNGCTVTLDLNYDIQMVVNWAKEKMAEEEKIKELAKKYPALQKAKENYETIKILVQNEKVK